MLQNHAVLANPIVARGQLPLSRPLQATESRLAMDSKIQIEWSSNGEALRSISLLPCSHKPDNYSEALDSGDYHLTIWTFTRNQL